jgi:lysophospholipase L1-like esterase
MRLRMIAVIAAVCGLPGGFTYAQAADIEWEVNNPFRFYKVDSSFALHAKAFAEVRGDPNGPIPPDVIWRVERRLNDPDCKDATTPATCAASKRAHYEESRLGWAAKTLPSACYDNIGRPRRYPAQCDRKYSWGSAKEDYVLPEAHTVHVWLSPALRAEAGNGACAWSWQPHGAAGKPGQRTQPCANTLTIERVPYATNRASSGVTVKVKLPDGRELEDADVTVEDLLVVGLGDSFASGDSNPDRPVTFSAARQMVYDPVMADTREQMATRSMKPTTAKGGMIDLASADEPFDPKALPKRLMEDEERGLIYKPNSPEFLDAFMRRSAQWMSADCHRSQYGYQFRVGMELALENRHRAVTLVHLACTGAETVEGLFLEKDAREQFDKPNSNKVPAQFDQLSTLLCRGGEAARTKATAYALPAYSPGDTSVGAKTITMRWCPPENRKRPIDVVLLSIGGNDVGFSAVALYAITESAGDLAPVAQLLGKQIRFGPDVARNYLRVFDRRMQAIKQALHDGFGVTPAQVVQTSYEPIQFDESGGMCGAMPTLGLDVHPKLRMSRERIIEAAAFTTDLDNRLECLTDAHRRPDCPAGLATGPGTGFRLVTDHLAKFMRRGVCARDPKRAIADGLQMGMPRLSQRTGAFTPYSPANALPYAHRWRLFHTANDAFLTANTHREGISPYDILQPAYAGLYSGAIHPTAEGHAMVADSVILQVRTILDKHPAHAAGMSN